MLLNLSAKLTSDPDETSGHNRLKRLNDLVQEIHPGISISVDFDAREDYNISAYYQFDTEKLSLETAATGVLQVVQIFAYLVLFRPRLLLIDEPDAHLHPDKQERLIETLERAAQEFQTQIILTTHSPHIARAATPNAKFVWMNEGKVQTQDDDAVRTLLGWGGLDKDVLFFIEDENDKPVRAILRQWPELYHKLAICRCFGVDNIPKDKFFEGLLVDGKLNSHALIHRDRDFMENHEAEMWRGKYKTKGTSVWVTSDTDVESYFCTSLYLSSLFDVSVETADQWRSEGAKKIDGSRGTFFEKRKQISRVLWPDSGAKASKELWEDGGEASPQNVLGKLLLRALKPIVKAAGKDDKLLDRFHIPPTFEVAPDLKVAIKEAIDAARRQRR